MSEGGAGDRVAVLDRALSRAKRRLRLRSVVRAGAVGLQVGLVLAIPAAVGARLLDGGAVSAAVAALGVGSAAVAVSLAIGMWVRGPDRRVVALLVDRLGATEELLLTALHVVGSADPNRDAILARLDPARLPDLRATLPIRLPRHLRFAVLPLAAVVAAALFVPRAVSWPGTDEPDVVADEGERIAERLADPADPVGEALPEALRRDLERLADDLQGADLTPEEARERLEQAQRQLEALQQQLAPSEDLLDELERAAAALDEASTRELGDALREGDLDAAAEAARDLSEDLAEASPEERERAAESLTSAGQELKRSSDPTLKGMGEAMERAGEAASGQPGDAPGEAAPGEEHGGGLSPQEAQALAEELAKARELGEQLARDRQAMERSQEINGALESSRQRLGGEAGVDQGEAGEGEAGEGEGDEGRAGPAGAPNAGGSPGREAGAEGHTWEDEGELASAGEPGGPQSDRQSDREGGRHVDDFQKLYEGVRLEGAESLVTSVEGKVDERGRVDQLPIRLTEAEEAAKTGTIELPAQYAEDAAQAIEAEPIPPAYKEAVKRYFDAME